MSERETNANSVLRNDKAGSETVRFKEASVWFLCRVIVKALKFNNPQMRLYMASMGKLFRVTAICESDAQANQLMKNDPKQVVIAEDCNGLIYLASQYGQICPSAVLADKEAA